MEENKIPTAEEFQLSYDLYSYDECGHLRLNNNKISNMLIEFAKMHVKEQQDAILAKAQIQNEWPGNFIRVFEVEFAYSLDNIK